MFNEMYEKKYKLFMFCIIQLLKFVTCSVIAIFFTYNMHREVHKNCKKIYI